MTNSWTWAFVVPGLMTKPATPVAPPAKISFWPKLPPGPPYSHCDAVPPVALARPEAVAVYVKCVVSVTLIVKMPL